MRTRLVHQAIESVSAFLRKLLTLLTKSATSKDTGKNRMFTVIGAIALLVIILSSGITWWSLRYELLPFGYIPSDINDVTVTTDKPLDKILPVLDLIYFDAVKDKNTDFKFIEINRRYRFFITYDELSRNRFRRALYNLPHHNNSYELMDRFMQHEWYIKKVAFATSMPFSDTAMLRAIISLHTASHFFQIPFSTLFCIIFQESKFDFKAVNPGDGRGMGQLTTIALNQLLTNRKVAPTMEKQLQAASIHLKNIYRDEVVLSVLDHMGFVVSFPDLGNFPKGGVSYFSGDPHKYGSVFNSETNILLSAMLLRYYMDYPWKFDGKDLRLSLPSKLVMAVAAYHRGQGAVNPYIKRNYRDNPEIDMEKAFETPQGKKVKVTIDSELSGYVTKIQECSCKD